MEYQCKVTKTFDGTNMLYNVSVLEESGQTDVAVEVARWEFSEIIENKRIMPLSLKVSLKTDRIELARAFEELIACQDIKAHLKNAIIGLVKHPILFAERADLRMQCYRFPSSEEERRVLDDANPEHDRRVLDEIALHYIFCMAASA